MKLLLTGGNVIDPQSKINGVFDVLIEDGKIKQAGNDIVEKCEKIDVKGKYVLPGLIDIHVHLREPGFEYKETIESGTKAALAGGYTGVACMPNTDPVMDNPAVVELVISKSKREGHVNVYPIASVSKLAKGEELSEIGLLVKSGAIAVSDDAAPIMSAELMRRALEYSKMFGIPVITHCEDKTMTVDCVMNEGYNSSILGLRGMPSAAESIIAGRNIELAEYTGGKLHICHVSARSTVELIRLAKKRGVNVTCETAPHYFTLTDDCLKTYDTNFKMTPPLRTKDDVQAVIEGLKDGTIDCIASDHAPHGRIDKEVEFNYAAFGVIGIETQFALTITELVEKKILSMEQAVEKLSVNPAKVLGLAKGSLKPGTDADISIMDTSEEYKIDADSFRSKSRNTPFNGMKVKGMPYIVIINGDIKYREGRIL
jgi:dihydroorotase